jgi:hypothetical protein
VHPITDPRARWNDFIYTVLQRLGIIPILAFLLLDPALSYLSEALHLKAGPSTSTRSGRA